MNDFEGSGEGRGEGLVVGNGEGAELGHALGLGVGSALGLALGIGDGLGVGLDNGLCVGEAMGVRVVGIGVAMAEGRCEDGALVDDGLHVGREVASVGAAEGVLVTRLLGAIEGGMMGMLAIAVGALVAAV